jgi:hypothetical protein
MLKSKVVQVNPAATKLPFNKAGAECGALVKVYGTLIIAISIDI